MSFTVLCPLPVASFRGSHRKREESSVTCHMLSKEEYAGLLEYCMVGQFCGALVSSVACVRGLKEVERGHLCICIIQAA